MRRSWFGRHRSPTRDSDTAYIHIAGRAGGHLHFQVMSWTLVVATLGSATGAMLAGARLLYGMAATGRCRISFFGYIHRFVASQAAM